MAKECQPTHLGEDPERERRMRSAEAAKARRLAMAPLRMPCIPSSTLTKTASMIGLCGSPYRRNDDYRHD
jgi:hypothetical protein